MIAPDTTRGPGLPLADRKAIDQACDRFEAAWKLGERPDLSEALRGHSGARRERLFRELLVLDVDYRRAAGDSPIADAYRERFPEFAPGVDEAFPPDREPVTICAAPLDTWATRATAGAGSGPDDRPFEDAGEARDALFEAGYDVLGELGRGGMGIVFRAREVALGRPVALKVIRAPDGPSADALRRFRQEAEAVARMDHPHIVPIYRVGQVRGLDYFSMKLIAGAGLDKSLGRYAGDARAAARLVSWVAEAVQHAHMRGILHRDLKPANILVDESGEPHVTDFGLAHRLEGDGEITRTGTVVGTPSYMSPEQAEGLRDALTTATDVYGLGAILYATLTGRAPLSGSSLMDTLQKVCTTPPDPPSRINPKVPRDLEVICLKCLEKDPRRRYQDARGLAEDLDRWLSGRPISARPVGPATRAWLWCRRHPVPSALSAALAASIVAGVGLVAWKWREADRNYRTSSGVVRFLSEKVLRQASTELTPRATNPTLREALDRASARVGGDFHEEPELEAAIREAVGTSYASLGPSLAAVEHLRKAFRLDAESLGPRHPTTLRVANELAAALDASGRSAEAEEALRRTLGLARRSLGPEGPATLEAAERLGSLLRRSGRPAEAEALLRSTLATRRRVLPADDPETLRSVRELGLLLADRGPLAEAEALAVEYERGIRCAFGPKHPDNVGALANRGWIALRNGRADEAESFHRRAVEESTRILGADHPTTVAARADLDRVSRRAGDSPAGGR